MSMLLSYRNKVRICSVIFATLIFLDIVACFDALSPILAFRKNYNIEKEMIKSSSNKTKGSKEDAVGKHMIHDIAIVLVKMLCLMVLLVCSPHLASYSDIFLSYRTHI